MTHITDETKIKIETRAQALVNAMAKHEYRNAGTHFDTNMTGLLPADKIEEMWNAIQAKDGAFVEQLKGAVGASAEGNPVVVILCKFAKGNQEVQVTFDANANISGFHVTVPQPAAAPAPTEQHAPA